MIMPCDNINATTRVRHCAYSNDCCRGIMSYLARMDANKKSSTALLINNLEIIKIFKDKDKEEEVSIIDFIR